MIPDVVFVGPDHIHQIMTELGLSPEGFTSHAEKYLPAGVVVGVEVAAIRLGDECSLVGLFRVLTGEGVVQCEVEVDLEPVTPEARLIGPRVAALYAGHNLHPSS